MTRQDVEQIFNTGYMKPTGDDWYNMVIGTLLGMGVYGGAGALLILELDGSKILIWAYLLSLLVLIIYFYWTDTKVKVVKTGLTKQENLDLLKKVFNQLGWSVHVYANEVMLEDNKYILKFIKPTFVYSNDFIGYNFKYTSSVQSGRPAFFLGIRRYLKNKFEQKLRTFTRDLSN